MSIIQSVSHSRQQIVQRVSLQRAMQQPFMTVLGVLVAGGAAKTGHGGWAAAVIVVSISTYFGALVTAVLARKLRAWIVRTQRYEARGSGLAALMKGAHKPMPTPATNRAGPHPLDWHRRSGPLLQSIFRKRYA